MRKIYWAIQFTLGASICFPPQEKMRCSLKVTIQSPPEAQSKSDHSIQKSNARMKGGGGRPSLLNAENLWISLLSGTSNDNQELPKPNGNFQSQIETSKAKLKLPKTLGKINIF